jgi:hypothetical protein
MGDMAISHQLTKLVSFQIADRSGLNRNGIGCLIATAEQANLCDSSGLYNVAFISMVGDKRPIALGTRLFDSCPVRSRRRLAEGAGR